MKTARQGSGLILVMLVITALTVCAHTLLRTVVYVRNGVHAQEKYVKRVYAAEGLLNYGIACAYEHFNKVPSTQESLIFDAWPVGNDMGNHGLVTLHAGDHGVSVDAYLIKEHANLCHLSCLVVCDEKTEQYAIKKWTHHTTK